MAGTGRSSKYDWSQPTAPSGMANWVANHRLITRIALIVVDAGLLVIVVTALHSSGRQWPSFLVLAAWLLMTANFGWIIPRQVDAWRRREHTPT